MFMASFDTLQKLAQHPQWLPPRSDVRVFLGEPGAPEANKTTVEPGNVFSPGMYTFGVTWWLRHPDSGEVFATETAPLEALRWRYEEGYLPLLHCETQFGVLQVRHTLFQDGTARERSEAVCGRISLNNPDSSPQSMQLYVALRSLGPAGGPLTSLAVGQDKQSFWNQERDLPLLVFAEQPSGIGCGVGDAYPLTIQGDVPLELECSDSEGWCFGLARFDLTLHAGETTHIHLDCPQQTHGSLQRDLPGTATPRPHLFEARFTAHAQQWRNRFSTIDLDVPDRDFRNAFFAGLQHMLVATVGDQIRIAPLSYPLPWLRDSVYIMRCFDLAGMHDVARGGANYSARNDFFGGFGAEGDAPGQGLWALIEHYRITRDKAWLTEVYPAIQRKCEWIFLMRRTGEPIRVVVDTPVLAFTHAMRASGIICLAAQDGIIMGSMDHGIHYALGWVNHWSLCGLREAAFAARELGFSEDATRYEGEAQALQQAFDQFVNNNPWLLQEERTVNSLFWPSRAWYHAEDRSIAIDAFQNWWRNKRFKDAEFIPEPYWLYFEAAQAHNALLIGDPQPAWQVVDYRMSHQDLPGLYGLREGGDGVGTDNAVNGVTLIKQLRGCQKFDSITPHGWSQAEFWLLQRAILVEEWEDGLMIFAGIPSSWLCSNAHIAFRNFPTTYGCVTAEMHVSADSKAAQIILTGVEPGTPVRLRLKDTVYTTTADPLVIQLIL
jgi:hypothetical protein